MKILTTFIFLVFSFTLISQTMTLSGPDSVEVGKTYTYYVTLNIPSFDTIDLYDFDWYTDDFGVGYEGEGGIEGLINNQDFQPYNVDYGGEYFPGPDEVEDSITIYYGDYDNSNHEGDVYLYIDFYHLENGYEQIFGEESVYIFRVFEPSFTSPDSIQACCADTITVTAMNYEDAQVFDWTVHAGGVLVGTPTSETAQIIPTQDATPIRLSCEVSRDTAHEDYSRIGSITIPRFTPQLSEIPDFDYICKGDTLDICVEDMCGLDSIEWTIPSTITVLSSGPLCLSIVADTSTTDGTSSTISYKGYFDGGCNSPTTSTTFKIYSYDNNPPTPDGYITVSWEGTIDDPCDPESWPVFVVTYWPNTPYANGYTTVTPRAFIPVPHHINENATVTVTVCNYNYCSSAYTFRYFVYDLPFPCDPGKPIVIEKGSHKESIENIGSLGIDEDGILKHHQDFGQTITISPNYSLKIIPNPFENSVKLSFPYIEKGVIILFNLEGIQIKKILVSQCDEYELNDTSYLTPGVYYLIIAGEKIVFNSKLLKL